MQILPETSTTTANKKWATTPCWGYGALWGFLWLCCLTAVGVDVFVTPGGDWLRHNDLSIKWFTVGGGDESIFGGCDVGLLSSQWCSYCEWDWVADRLVPRRPPAAVHAVQSVCCVRHRPCVSGLSGPVSVSKATTRAGVEHAVQVC